MKNFKKKSVLALGGAGFIGSHLTDKLLAQGSKVTVVDNLCSGRLENLNFENPSLRFENLDIGDHRNCEIDSPLDKLIAGADFVYHMASPIGVGRAHNQAFETTKRILLDGANVVECCLRHKKPVLYTSSSEIYGEGGDHKLTESDTAGFGLEPRWGYGAAKMAVEHLIAGLNRDHGIPSWIVRYFNVVGSRQNPNSGLVVSMFCKSALSDDDIEVHGDGSDRRTFLHVNDSVSALLKIPQSIKLQGRAVNVGGVENISINELAQLVVKICGQGRIVYRDYKDVYGSGFVNVSDRRPNLDLLTTTTDWTPEYTLNEAIRDCYLSMKTR